MQLRVIQAFAEHVVGELITDAEKVVAILESDARAFVVRVVEPAAETTESTPAKAKKA